NSRRITTPKKFTPEEMASITKHWDLIVKIDLENNSKVSFYTNPHPSAAKGFLTQDNINEPMGYHDESRLSQGDLNKKERNSLKAKKNIKPNLYLPHTITKNTPGKEKNTTLDIETIKEALQKAPKSNLSIPLDSIILVERPGQRGYIKKTFYRVHPDPERSKHGLFPLEGTDCTIVDGHKILYIYRDFEKLPPSEKKDFAKFAINYDSAHPINEED
ncbi:MAG: hypothetical protein ACD_7C00070G0001, partial [uncultured bacterium]